MTLPTAVAMVVFVLVALLMIGAILLQEGKGGGLAALGGTRAETAFGASNPIRRMTVVLAILFVLLAGFIAFTLSPPAENITSNAAGAPPTRPGTAPTGTGAENPGKVLVPPLKPGLTKGDEKKEGGKAEDNPKPDAAPEDD